jgi:hypothetical protein
MRDREEFEELSSVVALGLLAEDMVLIIGRVIRGAELGDEDRDVVRDVRRLFEMSVEEGVVPVAWGETRIVSDDAYRDALRIVRERSPQLDQAGRDAAQQLIDLLDAVLNGTVSEEQGEQLVRLREIFVEVGKTMLMRSNELMRSRQETISSWRPMQATSVS